MTEYDPGEKRLPAIGHPSQEPREPVTDLDAEASSDFADEHDATAVSDDITSGRDDQREEESPHGWAGLQS